MGKIGPVVKEVNYYIGSIEEERHITPYLDKPELKV
jgi:hypothetical protein